jgi:hypothetical protein
MLAKVMLIIVLINSFLYLADVRLVDDGFFSKFANVNDDTETVNAYGSIADNLPEVAPTGGFSIEGGGISFIDSLSLLGSYLLFLFNIIFAPVALFITTGMPLFLQLLIGLPLGIMYIMGIVFLFRGVGSSG